MSEKAEKFSVRPKPPQTSNIPLDRPAIRQAGPAIPASAHLCLSVGNSVEGKYPEAVGEFSEHVDAGIDRPPVGYLPYGERKLYVVADSLAALTGPTRGVVSLPRHLDWSGHAEYDLSRSARLAGMYKVVLSEAGSVDDLCAWLDGDQLLRLWPTLWLPPQLRRRWEERFPELAATRVAAA